MANPAELLHQQLMRWNNPSNAVSAEGARGAWDKVTTSEHLQASRHLIAIDELLRQLEVAGRRVVTYRKHYPTWVMAVYAYPAGWRSGGSGEIDSVAIDHLGNLGDVLTDFVPVLDDNGAESILDFTTRVLELLEHDTGIPAALKIHVQDAIRHVHWCLNNYATTGDFDLTAAVERLIAATMRAAGHSENKSRWRTVFDTFVWPFTVNMTAAIPATALAQLALGI